MKTIEAIIVSTVIVGLIVAGIIVIFNLFGRSKVKNKKKRKSQNTQSVYDAAAEQDTTAKQSLTQTINFYQGKQSFFAKEQQTAIEILKETGRADETKRIFAKCVMWTLVGVILALLINRSILLVIVFGAGFFMIPLWRLKMYRNKYRKYLASQLESSVSLITMSYIRSADIVKAVEENIEQISPIIRPQFQEFLNECAVTPSVKRCVRDLRDKINDTVFQEWCNTLLRTLDNAETRESLIPIANKYSEIRIVQDEINTETQRMLIEYIFMMAMDVFAFPMIRLLNKEWYSYYALVPGKIIMALAALVLLYSLVKLIAISQPVEYRK